MDIFNKIFSSLVIDLIDKNFCRGYVSLINKPTRRIYHSGTCLDHIHINSELSCVSSVIQTLISDRDAVFCSLPQSKPVMKTLKRIKFRDNSISSLNAFKSNVAQDLAFFMYMIVLVLITKWKCFLTLSKIAYDSTCKVARKQ